MIEILETADGAICINMEQVMSYQQVYYVADGERYGEIIIYCN